MGDREFDGSNEPMNTGYGLSTHQQRLLSSACAERGATHSFKTVFAQLQVNSPCAAVNMSQELHGVPNDRTHVESEDGRHKVGQSQRAE
jgi:hypothetical protein